MKFKKDGKAFEDIWGARYEYCRNITACRECGIGVNTLDCIDFCSKNPAEAARLMGYEVVEEETGWTLAEDGDGVVCPHCGADFCTLVYNAEEFIFCPSCGKKVKKEANMDKQKPLKDWTLEEVKEYCFMQRVKLHHGACGFCEESDCVIRKRGICQKEWVHDWDLDPEPRFTEEEVAFAKAMYAAIPDGVLMRNTENTLSWDVLGLGMRAWSDNRLPYKMFPSILPGQSVKLSDIVGGDTE